MDLQLAGKRALITGSTSGIGFATARSLASEGAEIILNGRSRSGVAVAVERLLDIVEDEIGRTPQYGLKPAPKVSWMWRHQSRMSLLSLIAAQNTCRFWQITWGSACGPREAA